MALTKNKKVLDFVEAGAELAQPDEIVWITGDLGQLDELRKEAVKSGELIKLNQSILPDCYLHRTKVNDCARVEDRTFICTKSREDAVPVNYWMDPKQAYELASEIARGSMKGRKKLKICTSTTGTIIRKWTSMDTRITIISRRFCSRRMQMRRN